MSTPTPAPTREEWLEANPLRAWRKSQTPKVGILDVAARIGVGASMVQMYERGVHKPGPKAEAGITALLGTDWPARWDAWHAAQPPLT